MVTGRPSIASKMPMKSLLLEGLERGQGRLAPGLVVGQDHLPHVDDPLALEEHVLGAAQADPLGAELAGLGGVLRACRRWCGP